MGAISDFLHAIPIEIKAGFDEKLTQTHFDPRCGSEVAPLHHVEFATVST